MSQAFNYIIEIVENRRQSLEKISDEDSTKSKLSFINNDVGMFRFGLFV